MLQLHDAKHFKFDGELKEDWFLVNTTNDTSFQLGRSKSIQTEDGIINPVFKGIKCSLPSLSFEIFKVDFCGEPCEMSYHDLHELNRWLDRNEPKALEVNGLIYYGIFNPTNGIWYPNEYGKVELTFDMTLPYVYEPITNIFENVELKSEFKIRNNSNVYGDLVYPDIEIIVKSGTKVTIRNLTNGQEQTLNNLTIGNVYKIYNQERQMVNLTNPKENIYTNSNKKYINLEYGVNRFRITTDGEVSVKITYQAKVCLQ